MPGASENDTTLSLTELARELNCSRATAMTVLLRSGATFTYQGGRYSVPRAEIETIRRARPHRARFALSA